MEMILLLWHQFNQWLWAIELGEISLASGTPLVEVAWFVAGLLILTGLTAVVLWWHRQSGPDPFAE